MSKGKLAQPGAIIFDFNGTLFYDTPFHNQAWMEFAAAYGVKITTEEMEEHVHGFTNKEILNYILKRPVEGGELRKLSEEKEAIYRGICKKNPELCNLTPGAEEFLNRVKEKKLPATIATASVWENVEFFIETFSLTRWFDPSKIVFDNGSYPGKPHPDMFLAAAKTLEVPSQKCMIIEDSPGGLLAAHRAGALKIIAYIRENETQKYRDLAYVDQRITNFMQIDLGNIALPK